MITVAFITALALSILTIPLFILVHCNYKTGPVRTFIPRQLCLDQNNGKHTYEKFYFRRKARPTRIYVLWACHRCAYIPGT